MAKRTEPTTEMQTQGNTLPAVIDFSADAGSGFEEASSTAYAIPFLRMLQKGSPQCDEALDDPAYNPDARPGDLFNTVSEQVYSKASPLIVIPVLFRPTFNLWSPRDSGGGFKGSMSEIDGLRLLQRCTRNEKNQDITPEGLILSDTREHYLMIIDPAGTIQPALLALTSTQIKKSKKWMSQMGAIILPNGKKAPMFSQKWAISAIAEKNDSGSWYGVDIKHSGPVTDPAQYAAAKGFLEMIRSGKAEAVHPGDDQGAGEDIPF